jgi:hypothetical protein
VPVDCYFDRVRPDRHDCGRELSKLALVHDRRRDPSRDGATATATDLIVVDDQARERIARLMLTLDAQLRMISLS